MIVHVNVYLFHYNIKQMVSRDANDSSTRHMTQQPQACMGNQTSKLYTLPGAYVRLSGNGKYDLI